LYNGGSEWQNDFSDLPDLMQAYYRNYDQALGRWTGVDPDAEGVESLTSYNYSANNPVMFNDPLGNLMEQRGAQAAERWFSDHSVYDEEGNFNPYRLGYLASGGSAANSPEEKQNQALAAGKTFYQAGAFEGAKGTIGDFRIAQSLVHGTFSLSNDKFSYWTDKNGYKINPNLDVTIGLVIHTISLDMGLGNIFKPDMMFYGVPVYFSTIGDLKYHAAFTLPGIGIFINPADRNNLGTLRHEYGHWLVGKKEGYQIFYRVDIPLSLLSAKFSKNNMEHQQSWTETRANDMSYQFFGRPADWDFNTYHVSDQVRYNAPNLFQDIYQKIIKGIGEFNNGFSKW
jgi:RHS repeat-associated protein